MTELLDAPASIPETYDRVRRAVRVGASAGLAPRS